MSGLSVLGVGKAFGGATVLAGVDLDVPDGTTLALLGPSGSGKSTLLRIVAGLERPDAGTVALGGHDVTGLPAHRRGVGVVFQDQALFPHLDVAANVGFGLRMAGVDGTEREARVREALALVGLPDHGRRDPATLSGGEAQRVALARALAPRPAVLLLDEPLAALDQLLRERLLVELRDLFGELGVTAVTVTHDPVEAAALGDRIAVLLDGRIAQVGTPGAVVAAPASARVAGLVGQRNVVVGRVVPGGLDTPLGAVPWTPEGADGVAAGHGVDVLVPPVALPPDPSGPLRARVRSLSWRAGTAFAVVADVAGEWGPLDVVADASWQVGDHVRFRLEPGATHVMPR